jgi:hypothetical protein
MVYQHSKSYNNTKGYLHSLWYKLKLFIYPVQEQHHWEHK